MNRIIPGICFYTLFILFGSCKKDPIQNPDASRSIIGSWELRQSSGGMMVGSNYPLGNGNILKFTDAAYEQYISGQLVKSGRYILMSDTTAEENICLVITAGEYSHRIIYDSIYDGRKSFIQVSGNKLEFLSGCYAYDAGQYLQYEKLH